MNKTRYGDQSPNTNNQRHNQQCHPQGPARSPSTKDSGVRTGCGTDLQLGMGGGGNSKRVNAHIGQDGDRQSPTTTTPHGSRTKARHAHCPTNVAIRSTTRITAWATTNSLSSQEGEAQMGFQHKPCAESRSSREGEYEARPQSSGKQRAQDKKPGNDGELKFLQAQLESLGIDSSFTGFLEDPIAHYVVSKLVDIATSERREKEQLIEEREHLAHSKQEMESQLTTALTKRQISPPMGEINERRAKKSREATP
ncbi:hypothetical protein BD779DRAFT_1670381 [Infundibulicybe gibba]|nr:hypothetical protein BD779DRAFT_1670381 [Infundibulicybe gibba]